MDPLNENEVLMLRASAAQSEVTKSPVALNVTAMVLYRMYSHFSHGMLHT